MTTDTVSQTAQPAGQTDGKQSPAPAQAPAPASGEMVEKARLDGALQKIQELTLANRTLTEQLAQKDQEIGRLGAEYKQKETEWQAQQGTFQTQLSAFENEKAELSSKVQAGELEKLKIKLITDAQKPALFAVLDLIQGSDEATIKSSIDKLGAFADGISKMREGELLAGVTQVSSNPKEVDAALPTSEADWQKYINGLPLGSPERAKAFDQWHSQLFKS